eukprot:4091782-Amphidinium_carterae.1
MHQAIVMLPGAGQGLAWGRTVGSYHRQPSVNNLSMDRQQYCRLKQQSIVIQCAAPLEGACLGRIERHRDAIAEHRLVGAERANKRAARRPKKRGRERGGGGGGLGNFEPLQGMPFYPPDTPSTQTAGMTVPKGQGQSEAIHRVT